MIAEAPIANNGGVSTAEISDCSISSEGEPPILRLYRKPRIKKRRFDAKNTQHPRKIYGIEKITNGLITTPPQPNSQPNHIEVNVDLSSAVVNRGPSEVSAWNAFILANKLFSNCCESITWVWNRCGKTVALENTASNEVNVQIEDGETEF